MAVKSLLTNSLVVVIFIAFFGVITVLSKTVSYPDGTSEASELSSVGSITSYGWPLAFIEQTQSRNLEMPSPSDSLVNSNAELNLKITESMSERWKAGAFFADIALEVVLPAALVLGMLAIKRRKQK